MQLNFLKKAAVLSLGLVSLVSCSGLSKVDYATFKSKAQEALKTEVTYTSAKATYTSKSSDANESYNYEFTVSGRALVAKDASGIAFATVANSYSLATITSADSIDSSLITFYAGSGFKYEITVETNITVLGYTSSSKTVTTVEYDGSGYITSYTSTTDTSADSTSTHSEVSAKISYSK
jgi:YD repeat-containing protein